MIKLHEVTGNAIWTRVESIDSIVDRQSRNVKEGRAAVRTRGGDLFYVTETADEVLDLMQASADV